MNKRSVFQGLLIALLCLTMANSYGQLFFPVKGTACAVWDAANNRYLYTYQDISKATPPKTGPVYNAATIYECDKKGANSKVFTLLTGQMKAPTALAILGNKLYVADFTKIWVVNLTDGTELGSIPAPGMSVQGITTDGVNTLYLTDVADSKIYWINLTTLESDTLAVDTNGVNSPTGIYFENTPKKSLFICSFIANSPIQRYDFSGDSLYTIKRTSYRFCYGITGDGKGNYYLSDWRSTAVNAGAIYKFTGGFDVANTYVDYLNFPAIPCLRSAGGNQYEDTLVVTELNNSKNTLRMVPANRDLVPPIVDTVLVANANSVVVYFNEPVNNTALIKTNYTGLGTVNSLALNAAKTEVTVILAKALTINLPTPFSVSNVQDLANNPMKQPYTMNVVYKVQSIYDNYLQGGITVYPNPVKNRLNVNYELLQAATVDIELYDLMGKKVADFYNGNQHPGEYTMNYQIPDEITSNGIYILKFTVDGQIIMSKIMLNR
jgi:hypothetical protein